MPWPKLLFASFSKCAIESGEWTTLDTLLCYLVICVGHLEKYVVLVGVCAVEGIGILCVWAGFVLP